MLADIVRDNLIDIQERIDDAARRAGRSLVAPQLAEEDDDTVRVVAATKYVDAEGIAQIVRGGAHDIGENRLDALEQKQGELAASYDEVDATWHFIGRLQSRKVADILPRVHAVHTLCTLSAAERIATEAVRMAEAAEAADVIARLPELLVQVNTAGDPDKDGVAPHDLMSFLEELPAAVSVAGLMTMPALASDPGDSREAFAGLRGLAEEARERFAGRHSMHQLSMGTSQDYEVAVEEGATLVRLGKVLYTAQTAD